MQWWNKESVTSQIFNFCQICTLRPCQAQKKLEESLFLDMMRDNLCCYDDSVPQTKIKCSSPISHASSQPLIYWNRCVVRTKQVGVRNKAVCAARLDLHLVIASNVSPVVELTSTFGAGELLNDKAASALRTDVSLFFLITTHIFAHSVRVGVKL